MGGLNSNIEASIWQDFDLSEGDSAEIVEDITTKLLGMIKEYPEHVFDIVSTEQIDELLESGRLADEGVARPPNPLVLPEIEIKT